MVQPIVRYGDPVLRRRARPVPQVTPEIQELIEAMIETMHAAPGIGLAAPQVGESLRVIVWDVGDEAGVLINPKIVRQSGSEWGTEGCLSIPGLQGSVERPERLVVRGLDASGKEIRVTAEGLLARCLCHEIDHLDGILFVDRADPASLRWLTETAEDNEETEVALAEGRDLELSEGERVRPLQRR